MIESRLHHSPDLSYRQLGDSDDVSGFYCGDSPSEQSVADFLKENALEEQRKGLNKTYLFFTANQIAAYVTLFAGAVRDNQYDGVPLVGRNYAPVCHIGKLAVCKEFQRQGIGKAVLEWVMAEAHTSTLGIRFLWLQVDKSNEEALDFYERFGFQATFNVATKNKQEHYDLWYDIYESA